MAKKDKKTPYKEKTLAIKDAENLTVEQVSAKSDELTTENLTKESSLDKYIRQHRSDIEKVKKERQRSAAEASEKLDQFVKTARDSVSTESEVAAASNVIAVETSETVTASDTKQEAVETRAVSEPEMTEVEPEVVESEVVESEVVESEEESEELDFPEIQGSFDSVILADDLAQAEATTKDEKVESNVIQEVATGKASDDVSNPSGKSSPDDKQTEQSDQKDTTVIPELVTDSQKTPVVIDDWQVTPDDKPITRKTPLIFGLCALLLLGVGGTVWYQYDHSQQKQATSASKSEVQKSEAAKKTAAFQKVYATFFLDDQQTKLKNDQFGKIETLTTELAKLKGQSDYDKQAAKVKELKAEISAIQTMNGNFDKAIIMNGALDKTAQVKDGAKLSFVATENTALNTLLKDAIAHGQEQQKAKTAAATSASQAAQASQAGQTAQTAQAAAQTSANQAASTTAPASSETSGTGLGPVSSGYGLNTAQYQTQYPNVSVITSNSRVPVDPNANLNDVAYAWAPGIRELVLQKCRERGYISGDNYILLPASIQKGNGYYNLYKSDGTYLVSINCKTGYFVGNAAGHADDLDY